jgi:beta-glucosidase
MVRLWKLLKIAAISVVSILVLVVAIVAGWIYIQMQPKDITAARAKWETNMSPEAADEAAQDLVSKMTLDEKLHEMNGSGMTPMLLSFIFRQTPAPGYAGGNDGLGIPPVAFSDGPRGIGCGNSTSFPVSIARAATWDVDLERRVGDVIGKEARAQGANCWGGLSINLVRHPSMGRAEESYGEDPWLMGEMAVAVMQSVQHHNVMACAKHFALNSQETARFKNDVQIDERTLREVYLPHFRKVVEHDVASFMSAYNKVRGEWCGENRHLLTTILREDWGFQGFVTSDWFLGVHDGAKGVHAGLDIEMPMAEHYGDNLKKLVEDGAVPQSEIDESVRRILRTKLRYLTREDPMEYPRELAAAPEHTALAREVAEKGMVLLKNEGPLLPLDKAATKTIAVVGHLADAENTGDRGSSSVSPPYRTSALKGLQDYLGAGATVLHADGSDLDEVTRVAGEADVVLIVAGSRHDEVGEYIVGGEDGGDLTGGMSVGGEDGGDLTGGMSAGGQGRVRPDGPEEKGTMVFQMWGQDEPVVIAGGDRVPLSLKERDLTVIAAATQANARAVVALVGGSVFTMEEWKDEVPAVLMAWYFGMEGGNALARVLFGEVNPSGKMPLTTPKDEAQLPFFDEFADSTEYGPYHGYTLFDREGHEAAFPFGHGLSYTTYEYENLTVGTPKVGRDGRLEVTVDVTNTGERAGEETVQLYIGFEGSKVERPVKLLRAFDKVALEPGEAKTVALSVEVKDLAWFNPDANAWEIEPMTYGVLVGPSSRSADLLKATFTVADTAEGL